MSPHAPDEPTELRPTLAVLLGWIGAGLVAMPVVLLIGLVVAGVRRHRDAHGVRG